MQGRKWLILKSFYRGGVLAAYNGIVEVRGSIPRGSTS